MSCSDVRGQDGAPVGRLPTLQDLLVCCDEDLLVRVVQDDHVLRSFGSEGAAPKRRRAVERRLRSTVSSMRHLPVKRKKGRSRLLMPCESFVLQGRSGLIERRVGARLLLLEDAPAACRMLEEVGDLSDGSGLPVRSYALDPWELVLASRVWLEGCRCVRERYLVLASAFWEMTFFGFEYDGVVATQERAKAERVLGASSSDAGAPKTAREERVLRAEAFGLAVPDLFELDGRTVLAERVGELNRQAELDLCRRFAHAARCVEGYG